jgi:hypothetical protein
MLGDRARDVYGTKYFEEIMVMSLAETPIA